MKLLERTKKKIYRNKNDENFPHLEITEVVLIHCSIVNNNDQPNSRVLYKFVLKKSFAQLFHQKISSFQKLVIHSFLIMKYGLLIKTLNRWK